MKTLIRVCALYNGSALAIFLTPGLLSWLGVEVPESPAWVWLPALLALFAAITLWVSSGQLGDLATLPYWNGIIRLAFAIAAFTLGFGETAGGFITLIAAGDLLLGLIVVVGLPRATGRTHLQLLTNRGLPSSGSAVRAA